MKAAYRFVIAHSDRIIAVTMLVNATFMALMLCLSAISHSRASTSGDRQWRSPHMERPALELHQWKSFFDAKV